MRDVYTLPMEGHVTVTKPRPVKADFYVRDGATSRAPDAGRRARFITG